MKSRNNLLKAVILALVTLTLFSLVACGGSGNDKPALDQKTEQDAVLYTINGVDVTKAEVEMIGETPNLQIIFSNSTDKDVDLDFSQLTVKLSDGTEVGNAVWVLRRGASAASLPWATDVIATQWLAGADLG